MLLLLLHGKTWYLRWLFQSAFVECGGMHLLSSKRIPPGILNFVAVLSEFRSTISREINQMASWRANQPGCSGRGSLTWFQWQLGQFMARGLESNLHKLIYFSRIWIINVSLEAGFEIISTLLAAKWAMGKIMCQENIGHNSKGSRRLEWEGPPDRLRGQASWQALCSFSLLF